jgi:hypothetical protein
VLACHFAGRSNLKSFEMYFAGLASSERSVQIQSFGRPFFVTVEVTDG